MKNYNNIAVKTMWTFVLIFCCYTLKAQDSIKLAKTATVSSLTKARLTFLGVGLEREQRISKLTTLYAGISMDAVFPFEPDYKPNRSDALSLLSFIGFTPIMYSGFRTYYNLKERAEHNRKTMNNSSEYFGLEIDAIMPIASNEGEYKTLFTMSFAPQWGIQRNLSKNTTIDFTLGPALKTNFEVIKLFPFGRFGLSFLL